MRKVVPMLGRNYFFLLRRRLATRPARATPISASVSGSGTVFPGSTAKAGAEKKLNPFLAPIALRASR